MEVVSIGTNPTFKVNKVPMEYVPTMSKRFQFFGSRFLSRDTMFFPQNVNIYGFVKSQTKKVESFRQVQTHIDDVE